jgi:hypothetical protein
MTTAPGPEDCRMHRWDRRREAAPSRGGGEPAWQKDRSASEKGRPHFCGSKASWPYRYRRKPTARQQGEHR